MKSKDNYIDYGMIKKRKLDAANPSVVLSSNKKHDEVDLNDDIALGMPVVDKIEIKKSKKSDSNLTEREWKKALFKRWDEYRALRRDVILKLNELISSIPENVKDSEKHILDLRSAENRLKTVLASIEELDDSQWNRQSFSKDLADAMRKVENARMDFMITNSKLSIGENKLQTTQTPVASNSNNSIIHELTSLSFKQAFRLGFAFFAPLIIGLMVAALIIAILNYITIH